MPKRSNDFQKLIKLLESQLALDKVQVEESKLLKDQRSGQPREVDIYIESEINEHPISIAIECRDQKRKAGSPWIEQLIGKFKALPVHKVIAISKSGFSGPAKKIAQDSNIELLTFEEAINEDWVRAVKNHDEIYLTLARFKPVNTEYGLSRGLFEEDRKKIRVFDREGKALGTLDEYTKYILFETSINKQISIELISNYDPTTEQFRNGNNLAKAKWRPKEKIVLKDDYKFVCELKEIIYSFVCLVHKTATKTERFTYNKAQVATTTKDFFGLKLIFSIAESKNRGPTLAISAEVEESDGETHTYEIFTNPLPVFDGSIELTSFLIG